MTIEASIYSVYMNNISQEIITYQKQVVAKFLPPNCTFEQYLYIPKDANNQDQIFISAHDIGLEECFQKNTNPFSIFLDIDCIPLSETSFQYLIDQARDGSLVGGAHFASHIADKDYVYVSPSCMALSNSVYHELGSPPFHKGANGDCAQELTRRWQSRGKSVKFLFPSNVEQPRWSNSSLVLGLGTTYEDKFYHAFLSRHGDGDYLFIKKCKEVLSSAA